MSMKNRKWTLQKTVKLLEESIVIQQKIIFTKQKMLEALLQELKKE